ncbi:acyltransferase family protein [Nonomuraea sp. NBC_00507]|uniref:acyltransferase family protein n=1 Tax=Nonomuraea sp. NBC_00507 TaxID=2976002 RepID=UPI002E17A7D1
MASAGAVLRVPSPRVEQLPAPYRKREPYLDNVKFVLAALVVIGHALRPTVDADSARSLYIFIYTFHMPLFVVISGYLSRNFWGPDQRPCSAMALVRQRAPPG